MSAEFVTVEEFAPQISMKPHQVYRLLRECPDKFPFEFVKLGRLYRIRAITPTLNPPQTAEPYLEANGDAAAQETAIFFSGERGTDDKN